ncbi:MAG: 2-C-methyl-D-erythritol 4-phosphate cytidylyltransferase [Gammaproteobacteria bacterium]
MNATQSSAHRRKFWVVIPAAGVGARMGAAVPKQYLPLGGRTVIEQTLTRICGHPGASGVVVAVAADDSRWESLRAGCRVPILDAEGGSARCHSVLNALDRLAQQAADDQWVLVHDAARPCVRHADVDRLVEQLWDHPVGGLLAVPVRDTMKRADDDGTVCETVERHGLWHALTPQMFRLGPLRQALRAALAAGALVTDEASAMEFVGEMPRLVLGSADNIKITRPEDLALAEFYLREQQEQ